MDKRDSKKKTIQDLDDSDVEELFKVLGSELARRDLMVNFSVDLNNKETGFIVEKKLMSWKKMNY